MNLSRRDLLRAGVLAGGVGSLGGLDALLGSPAAAATGAQYTTLTTTLRRGTQPGAGGYGPVVTGAGEPHLLREDLGIVAKSGRSTRRKGILSFAQITDVHVIDSQSPMRVEYLDRYEDQYSPSDPVPGLLGSAYRPHEMLTAHVADSMVRAINKVKVGPVTGKPLAFTLQTGDNSDNCQYNEVRWNIDILDGHKTVTPDSGDLTTYEGVSDGNATYYDTHYWHPHGVPAGKTTDDPRSLFGFPTVPGLLDAARRPFSAAGLSMPWYAAFGNHDGLVQGNLPHTLPLSAVATGNLKLISPPLGYSQADLLAVLGGAYDLLLASLVLTPYVRTVTADPNRRIITKPEIVAEHFKTTGTPVGHGFTSANQAAGTAYYTFSKGTNNRVLFIVLDTCNENGYDDGSLDQPQFDWLKTQLAGSAGKIVVIASHHTVDTMTNSFVGTGGNTSPRVLGDAVLAELLTHKNVVAWLNGHTHRNQIWPHSRGDGTGGIWEINTASHVEWPQQSRLIELVDNKDGTMSIFTTMVDQAGPTSYAGKTATSLQLASLSRELAANDWQERASAREGAPEARNVELLVKLP